MLDYNFFLRDKDGPVPALPLSLTFPSSNPLRGSM